MLMTQFVREGELVPLRWGWWHISCFLDAFRSEQLEAPDGESDDLSARTEYSFRRDWEFVDPSDGEVLTIRPGDRFRWWRD